MSTIYVGSPSEDDAIMEVSRYFLDGAREWTLSSQTTQHVDSRSAPCARSLILASAFEWRDDKLCAARRLAELLRLVLEEVLSDFEERGEIRKFCVWRGAPMLCVNCELPGAAPGLLPAGREGGARRGLHGLGGSRVLLQECVQRLPVRRCGAPAPPL